ncbi:MAG: septum formation family protein [Trebonia sp.]
MSTEATGDGRAEAVGATQPAAGAPAAEPAVDESDESGEPGRSGEPDEASDDYGECTDAATPETIVYDESLEYDEAFEADEADEADEGAEPRRTRRWPRVLLAGGFIVLAAAIVGGAIAIVGSLTHGFKKPVKVTYKTSAVFSLKTGDCFDPQGAQSYSLASCDAPHQAEVFATFALTGTTWPGAAAIQSEASGGCASRLAGYVNPQLAISLTSTYVYPDSVAWQAGTRTVICEVRATSGQLTGSVRAATASAG